MNVDKIISEAVRRSIDEQIKEIREKGFKPVRILLSHKSHQALNKLIPHRCTTNFGFSNETYKGIKVTKIPEIKGHYVKTIADKQMAIEEAEDDHDQVSCVIEKFEVDAFDFSIDCGHTTTISLEISTKGRYTLSDEFYAAMIQGHALEYNVCKIGFYKKGDKL